MWMRRRKTWKLMLQQPKKRRKKEVKRSVQREITPEYSKKST